MCRNHLHMNARYSDIIMSTIGSQITSLTIVYSVLSSGADQRKHQSSASLAFVQGIHRCPVNSPHKWPVTRKMFPFHDVIMDFTIVVWQGVAVNLKSLHWDLICCTVISGQMRAILAWWRGDGNWEIQTELGEYWRIRWIYDQGFVGNARKGRDGILIAYRNNMEYHEVYELQWQFRVFRG